MLLDNPAQPWVKVEVPVLGGICAVQQAIAAHVPKRLMYVGLQGGLDYQKKTVEELGVNYRVQSSGAGPLAVPEDVAPLPGALSMCPCTLTSTCLILRTFTRPTSPTLSSRATARAAGACASPNICLVTRKGSPGSLLDSAF